MSSPNGPNDTATFQASSITGLSISGNTELNGIIFNPGANSYSIASYVGLTISGAGIANDSGVTHTFVISGSLSFLNAATAGDLIIFYNSGAISFSNSSRAGSATFTNNPGTSVTFYGDSSAGNAAFNNARDTIITFWASSDAGSTNFTMNGSNNSATAGVKFKENSSAASSQITATGSPDFNHYASSISFSDSATAGSSTLVANGSTGSGAGTIFFSDNSTAETATLIANNGGRIMLAGNASADMAHVSIVGGTLDVSGHNAPGTTVGSIDGNGLIRTGGMLLTVGTNNIDTTFAGVISDGLLVKAGTGTLHLTGSSTYRGGTRIDNGTLRASHDGALGLAPLSGSLINNSVTVGSGATLTLDSGSINDYIGDASNFNIVNSSIVNLNFTGNPDRLRSLILDGITQPPGIYGGPLSGAPNQLPQFTGTGTVRAAAKAVSRKIHGSAGAFDVDLPLVGQSGIECRHGGSNREYQIVVNFLDNVTFSNVGIISGSGSVSSYSGSGTNVVTINLTGVANAQVLYVAIYSLNDGTGPREFVIPMAVLVADVNDNKIVNASDVVQVKTQLGQPATSSNFRADIIANGVINTSDVIQAKLQSGMFLP